MPVETATNVTAVPASTQMQAQQLSAKTSNDPANNMTTPPQSEQVTADVLANDVAPFLSVHDCIPLASALCFDLLYISRLASSALTGQQAYTILLDWLAANGKDATCQALQRALERINRLDLAKRIMARRAEGKQSL